MISQQGNFKTIRAVKKAIAKRALATATNSSPGAKMDNLELLADLAYLARYAQELHKRLMEYQPITGAEKGFAARMKTLAIKAEATIQAVPIEPE